MIALDIVTPVSRPMNLRDIEHGVLEGSRWFDLRWYQVHDCKTAPCDEFDRKANSPYTAHVNDPQSDAGWAQRNWHLDHGRPDAFIWWLDDDGMVHPDFFPTLHANLSAPMDHADRTPLAVLFSMAYPHMKNGQVLTADPNGMRISGVSGSMAIFHRTTVGDLRATTHRTSDGSFLEHWWRAVPHNRVVFDPRPLVLFNPLDPTRPE